MKPPPSIGANARIGESIMVPTKLMDEKPKKEVDLGSISLDDLESLKKTDPFMYYSIPQVKRATVLMRNIDMSSLLGPPARAAHQGEAPEVSQKVSRSTRHSFECHPDFFLGDLLWDDLDDDLEFEGAEEPNPQDMDF